MVVVLGLLFGVGEFGGLEAVEVRRFEVVHFRRFFLLGLAVGFPAHPHELAGAEVLQPQHLVQRDLVDCVDLRLLAAAFLLGGGVEGVRRVAGQVAVFCLELVPLEVQFLDELILVFG